jgi:predicted DNA-binding transcriptional regulator AlpA
MVNEETLVGSVAIAADYPLDIEKGGRITAPLEESKAWEIVLKQNHGSTIPDVEKSYMSHQPSTPTLLGEPLIQAIREAVRAELQSFATQSHTEDRLLNNEAAAQVLSVSTEWLYHNSLKLPFTRKLGSKMLRFSYLGIQKYLAARIGIKELIRMLPQHAYWISRRVSE